MLKNNYEDRSKENQIRKIRQLKKRKKYGLVWEHKSEDVVELCKIKFDWQKPETILNKIWQTPLEEKEILSLLD